MSNNIQYDSLLVHYLARELHERLAGDRLRSVAFDADQRRFSLEMTEALLIWELHPTRGWIRWSKSKSTTSPDTAVTGWGGREVPIQRRARVLGVAAPPDERLLEIVVDAGGEDRAGRFVLELMTNQWNVVALDPRGRIVRALWPRVAGGRVIRRGAVYITPWGAEPPNEETGAPEPIAAPYARHGTGDPLALDEWIDLLDPVEPERRRGTLLREVAWTSSLNASAILGDASSRGGGGPLEEAWERYGSLASRPAPSPRVLSGDGAQPYPLPVPGVPDVPADSLLEALAPRRGSFGGVGGAGRAAEPDQPGGEAEPEVIGTALAPEIREALEARRNEAATRARRLRTQVEAAPARAEKLRRQADLLISQLHRVPKGAAEADLDDFEGGTVVVSLDPALEPHENAEAWYDKARKRERAVERLPPRIREAEAERDQLDALLRAAEAGEADPEELARWIREVRPSEGPGAAAPEERLPYSAFRSSGGYEIRVGKGAKSNDELTFHHSSPDDVWMHARDVAGAHVILRWPDRDQNPPKRDLTEAAILAAIHSKARTAGVVPVDWTRRKYVRKPRKAPPGAVLPDRVSTVFVEPDPAMVERLKGVAARE